MKGIGHKTIDSIEDGTLIAEEAAELAAFTDPDTLQEAADIAFNSAVENVSGWEDGIDEPDPAVVAHRLHGAARRFGVAAVLRPPNRA